MRLMSRRCPDNGAPPENNEKKKREKKGRRADTCFITASRVLAITLDVQNADIA